MTLVLQKMIARSSSSVRSSRRVVSVLARAEQEMAYWSMSGLSSASGRTVISTSSRWYIQLTVMTSCEMVAENRPMLVLF